MGRRVDEFVRTLGELREVSKVNLAKLLSFSVHCILSKFVT